MYINRIRIENFKSIYEPIELDFNNIKGFWKIAGSVGSGKTTIGEAIIYGLFGSVGGKNQADLISWGRKHGIIELWCTSKTNNIYIKRELKSYGQSPLYVEVDGEELAALCLYFIYSIVAKDADSSCIGLADGNVVSPLVRLDKPYK